MSDIVFLLTIRKLTSNRRGNRHSTKHGLDWTVGLDSWTGQLDWTVGLDSWTGQLDWTIGLGFFSVKYTQFDVFEESEMIIFKLLFLSVKFLWPVLYLPRCLLCTMSFSRIEIML